MDGRCAVLVPHAASMPRGIWSADEVSRPLSAEGLWQADRLAAAIGAPIAAVQIAGSGARLAKSLDDDQLQRYLTLRNEYERRRGTPSRASKWFRPAETERKLVLFTLAIVVVLVVVALFVLEMWAHPSAGATTALIGLAGTGIGFIGGMVS